MSRAPEIIQSAEQAVFASLLLDGGTMTEVAAVLEADDFSEPVHRKFWNVCLELFQEDTKLEPVVIAERTPLADAGDLDYLIELSGMLGSAVNVRHYADVVREDARKRRVATAGREITDAAVAGEVKATVLLDRAQALLMDIADDTVSQGLAPADEDVDAMTRATDEAMRNGGKPVGLTTGLHGVDALLMGLKPTSLNILAARPSMGKTALALNVVDHLLEQGLTVAVWSLEMERLELLQRITSAASAIDLGSIITGKMRAEHWVEYMKAAERLNDRGSRLLIDDAGTVTPVGIRAGLRRALVKHDVKLVVVDYLQLMTGSKRFENRTQEVSEISRSLKLIAKDFKIPVLALSQLSRAIEMRPDPTPRLSDLRESGSIEQDADTVTFIHREEEDVTIHVAKNRNGPIGVVGNIGFAAPVVKFFNISRRSE